MAKYSGQLHEMYPARLHHSGVIPSGFSYSCNKTSSYIQFAHMHSLSSTLHK